MKLCTARDMQGLDRRTIDELGLPGIVLMENASRGAVRHLVETWPDLATRRVGVMCGRGNNGGDGLAMARMLADRGVSVEVYLLTTADKVGGDARINLEVVEKLGLPLVEAPDAAAWEKFVTRAAGCDLFVDAVLGTGLNSEVRGFLGEIIDWLNAHPSPVFAVDLPSGLDADTGRPLGRAVRAAATATFGLAKLGHHLYPGLDYVGRLAVIDIGIPPRFVAEADLETDLLDRDLIRAWLPVRDSQAHKGTFGHLLVVGGSVGKSGAPCLAGVGAARAGAGLVTVAGPATLNNYFEVKMTEVMTEPLPETTEGFLDLAAENRIRDLLETRSALAWGPGLGTSPATAELTRRLLVSVDRPAVVDADGLNHLAGHLDELQGAAAGLVLTPHPGEAARLLNSTTGEIQADRVAAVRLLAAESGQVAVLKGARTLIAAPDGRLAINPTGNVALASGGSGDVLTGMIGSFLAQGSEPFVAACLGVYGHGLAADVAAEELGGRGVLAGDLAEFLPAVWRLIESDERRPG
jgi:NAD(P)H-hydrate epimerase